MERVRAFFSAVTAIAPAAITIAASTKSSINCPKTSRSKLTHPRRTGSTGVVWARSNPSLWSSENQTGLHFARLAPAS
jgi:hypothetical protein